MKKLAGWTAAVVLASAGSLAAHHSLAQYDTNTAVRVKGTIVRFERVNPHTILFIDERTPDGEIERWAVEGPAPNQLGRRGFGLDFFRPGDVIEACGYVVKEGVSSRRTLPIETVSSTPKSVSGRIMDGELIVMPDGRKYVWSDYGHHRCFDGDSRDDLIGR